MTYQTLSRDVDSDFDAMAANLRCFFRSYRIDSRKPDKRFSLSDGVAVCLREHLPEPGDENAGVDYDICLIGPQGLLPILAIPHDHPSSRSAQDIWAEFQYFCGRNDIRLEPWTHSDLPEGVEAFKAIGDIDPWLFEGF